MTNHVNYGEAIRSGFDFLLSNYPEVFVIGQGLWSPWYVGNSMTDLDKVYGRSRLIDTPVSESACTGAAVGASIVGMKPIVVHPRMDFMLYGMDSIVNQASKWSYMFGGQTSAPLTVRSIINRGGEQGAQHSQALHSWFAHIPGLKVVMPYSVADARDLLVASVLSPDPVIYIDDRWLYNLEAELAPCKASSLDSFKPHYLSHGDDITIVGSSYSSHIALETSILLQDQNIHSDVIDLRVVSPLDVSLIISSITRTRKLVVIDSGWASCGLSSEIIASVFETTPPSVLCCSPLRLTLPACPAPTSSILEKAYYHSAESSARKITDHFFVS
jgi:pyruvate/2-oxoglutarate/acetoin dehydrogenase E1 component